MNKTELIDRIAMRAGISKAASARAVDALICAVQSTLKINGAVNLIGLGTFSVSERAERAGRNPRTGEAIQIKATKLPKFKPGKALKIAINYVDKAVPDRASTGKLTSAGAAAASGNSSLSMTTTGVVQ